MASSAVGDRSVYARHTVTADAGGMLCAMRVLPPRQMRGEAGLVVNQDCWGLVMKRCNLH
jgi:hypothetical protein